MWCGARRIHPREWDLLDIHLVLAQRFPVLLEMEQGEVRVW